MFIINIILYKLGHRRISNGSSFGVCETPTGELGWMRKKRSIDHGTGPRMWVSDQPCLNISCAACALFWCATIAGALTWEAASSNTVFRLIGPPTMNSSDRDTFYRASSVHISSTNRTSDRNRCKKTFFPGPKCNWRHNPEWGSKVCHSGST